MRGKKETHWVRHAASIATAGLMLVLAACGKATEEGGVRFVNVSSSSLKADLYAGDDRIFSSIGAGQWTDYSNLEEGTYTFKVTSEGNSTALVQGSVLVPKDASRTVVAYGPESNLKLTTLTEDEGTPSSGDTRVRILNASSDAGPIDVFIGAESQSIDSAPTTMSNVAAGATSSFVTVSRGTYRLRIAGAGDRNDLRFDRSGFVLENQEVVNLIVSSGPGGFLVDVVRMKQTSTITAFKNPFARVRIAAAAVTTGVINTTIGSTTVASAVRAPSVANYVWVNSGNQSISTTVAGATVSVPALDLLAGGDYTLLVHGRSPGFAANWLVDNNQLPTNTARGKMRLVNGAIDTAGGLTLTVDFSAIATNINYPNASSYGVINASNTGRVEVASPTSGAALYSATDLNLVASGVYSLFILGESGNSTGILRRDR